MSFVIRADNLLKYMSLSHVISTPATENSLIPTTLHVTVLHITTWQQTENKLKETWHGLGVFLLKGESLFPLQNLISCHVG